MHADVVERTKRAVVGPHHDDRASASTASRQLDTPMVAGPGDLRGASDAQPAPPEQLVQLTAQDLVAAIRLERQHVRPLEREVGVFGERVEDRHGPVVQKI